ncbi:hypothetical protein MHK_007800 [Candidatus Magnetomorum sp. HK-1]|nr:hypothetical protein MHK_007800 [Candidatus Magnetomorum sp. HK-1]
MKKKKRKPDDPIIVYRQLNKHIARMSELIDQLSKIQGCYLDQMFAKIWPVIQKTIPKIKIIALIGMKEATEGKNNIQINIHASNSDEILFTKTKSSFSEFEKILNKASDKEHLFWNFRPEAPQIFNNPPDQNAIVLTFLTRLPNDEKLFLVMATQKSTENHHPNDFFINYEINTLRLMSKMIGWHISSIFNFEVNQYLMARQFEGKQK